MQFDPFSLVLLGLMAILIFFMFRNGRKRQQMQQELRNNMQPGVEVMLGSGIYGRIISVDEEAQRVTIASGDAALEVHQGAIAQIVPQPEAEEVTDIAPDDDPEFGKSSEDPQN